ncbi:proline transporter 1 [Artemisia annua]|uniref:Proline transporter 1 n=1 Tax=Artemisia annua TaxID=35608 RepID=A0A2U1MPJ1_ARTAN|nr:proline transporter 1 [Artemisia annua]
MATVAPTSPPDAKKITPTVATSPKKLDAGALFVLKSRGSWIHCGYHLTTAIVAPALLSLPFALALLGWEGGVVVLMLAAIITFYSYNLLSLVLEHHAELGKRQLRPGWGRYYVGPLQLATCYGAVIACTLLGGQSLKFIYLLARPDGSLQLSHFIVIFGIFTLILAQIPSFHSLRHINLVSLILCFAYCACTTAGAIYIGDTNKGPRKNYSLTGTGVNRIFGFFNAISIICTTYGNGIIPEIQATIAEPVKGKMFKGLLVCYAVVISCYFSVGISGYWAFGNQVESSVLQNFMVGSNPLLPKWFLLMTNGFTVLQVAATSLVYLQPSNVVLERKFANPEKGQLSLRNFVPRLITRSLSVIIATTFAAMLPFFGDIMALFGAFGCIPLDFILPMVFYNLTFKPSKKGLIFWVNTVIGVASTGLSLIGAVASVRQIILDARTYRLFANM